MGLECGALPDKPLSRSSTGQRGVWDGLLGRGGIPGLLAPSWGAASAVSLCTGVRAVWRAACAGRGRQSLRPGAGALLTVGADHTSILPVSAVALQPAQGAAVGQRGLCPRALHLVQHDRARSWWHSKDTARTLGLGRKGPGTGLPPGAPHSAERQPSQQHSAPVCTFPPGSVG